MGAQRGKSYQNLCLEKMGCVGVVDGFLGKAIHRVGLRVEVKWVKR